MSQSATSTERFCALAADMGVIITPDAEKHLIAVDYNMTRQLGELLSAAASSSRYEALDLPRCLGPVLSGCLTEDSLRQIQKDLSSFLRSRLRDLRLSDVKTEVLASWLVEIQLSGSSSGGSDGESAGELPTPSRTETAPDREGGQ